MNLWTELKDRFSCQEIASEAGIDISQKKAVCPFCNYKKNPSFYVTDDFFVCHHSSCQQKGDIFNLIALLNNVDRFGALQILSKKAGVEVTLTEEDKKIETRSEIFKEFLERYLIKDWSSPAAKYLLKRGLTREFVEKKMIGFIPAGTSGKDEHDYIKETGLPGILSGYILIPFWNGSQVVYFTGRSLDGQDPKYKNQKGAKTYIGTVRGPELIVTEGIFDQLLAEQSGLNSIGLAGSSGDIKIHKGIKQVHLIFDGDNQGRKYIDRYGLSFCSQGAEVKLTLLEEGSDLADYLSSGEDIKNLETISLKDYYLEKLSKNPRLRDIKETIYKIVQFGMDEIEKEETLQLIKQIKKVPLQTIRKDYANYIKEVLETEYLTPGGEKYIIPPGYSMTDKEGILFNGRLQVTYEPFFISRIGSNKKTKKEYVETMFSVNGRRKTRVIERQRIAVLRELIEESAFGAPVNSANGLRVVSWLDAWIAKNRDLFPVFEVVNQLGWTEGDRYILSDRIIGSQKQTGQVYYKGELPEDAYIERGTLEDWIRTIKLLGQLKSGYVVRFLLYAGFASAILEPLGLKNFIVHLHGDTSEGKTTGVRVPASIYGNPIEGKALIRWNNTYNFIIRYMEGLKNIPFIIDDLSGESERKSFGKIIYDMEGGISKGKASSSNPNATVPQRSFKMGIFSTGEPPIISEKSFGGEMVRVWEFHGSPFGESNAELIVKLESGLKENFGVAIKPFLDMFLKMKAEFLKPETFCSEKDLTNAEDRMLKLLNVVYTTGIVVNEMFDLKFDVKSDFLKIFEQLRQPIAEIARTVEKILDQIQDHVAIEQAAFPEIEQDLYGKNTIKKEGGKLPFKIFGYLFPNSDGSSDLGIIKSHFVDFFNQVRGAPTGGLYAINRLHERGYIKKVRESRRIHGKSVWLVYFENFFTPEKQEDPF